MSDTDKIDVWSNWYVIEGDLRSTIETRSSNGAQLDPAISADSVIIKKTEDDKLFCCQLHLDTTKLTGYYLRGVAVTSEARNVEVYYDNGEYIGTAGRTALNSEQDDKCSLQCCCTYELDDDIIISRLLLKLLSLRGKDQIKITKISLSLMENYGRGEEQEQMNTAWSNEMTPASLADLPPFVQSVFNGLYSASSSDEMNKLIVMLREARIAKEEEERKEMERQNEQVEDDKKQSEDKAVPLPSIVPANDLTDDNPTDDDPLTALEIKLKQFITDQLTLLEQRIETKLNNVLKRLDNLESLNDNK